MKQGFRICGQSGKTRDGEYTEQYMPGESTDRIETESAQMLAERLQLPFKNFTLLNRALTHRSYINENPDALEDNERLEFLGDAVLDFLVGAWLYNHFPEMAEGYLTRMRSALVGTKQLAAYARKLELGGALRLGRGEDEGGGRNRNTLLCATFEAIVGALFLDAGIEAVKAFVEPMLEPVAEKIIEQRDDLDPKSTLQEWAQANGKGVPLYRELSVTGPDHERLYTIEVVIDGAVYASGQGSSKQAAGKSAAAEALDNLGVSKG